MPSPQPLELVQDTAGLVVPAGMPQPLVQKLHGELVKILNQPDVKSRIEGDGSQPVGSSPEEFRAFMKADMDKWAKLVKESGAKLN